MNTIWFHLYVDSKKAKQTNQKEIGQHKYGQQTVGHHRERGSELSEIGEGEKEVQTTNCKISYS